MRTKLFLFLLSLIFTNFSSGQPNYFTHSSCTKGEEFSFPIFSNPGDSSTTKTINQYLQLSELELMDGYQSKNLFEVVNKDNGGLYGGKQTISYKIFTNTS